MTTLPRPPLNTTTSPHFHGAANRVPSLFSSSEAFGFCKSRKQGPFFQKQKTSLERTTTWKPSAMAEPATQANLAYDKLSSSEVPSTEENGLSDWNSQWYPAAVLDNLDKRIPTAVTIMGRDLVLWWDRKGQSWQVWANKCPHCLAPLSEGQITEEGELQCSYHGWCFAPSSGNCTHIPQAPSDGAPVWKPQCACASVYPSVEQEGLLWFWRDTRPEFRGIATRQPPPSIPALADPTFKDELHSRNLPYGYEQLIENLRDPAHVPFAHHGQQATVPEGSDKRSSDEGINTLRTQDANHDAFTSMAVEIGSAILKVDHGNTVPLNGNGAHSSLKAQLKENPSHSFKEHWQSSNGEEAKSSGQNSVLDTGEAAGSNLSSELPSSLSEAEHLTGEIEDQLSSSKVSVSSSPSAVTLKKPITVARPLYEITDTTDTPGALSDSNEDSSASVRSTDSGSFDLTTGLQALRRLIFRKHFDLAKDLAKKLYGQYPGDTDVLMEYAFVERQRGDLVAAGALYSQAISTYKDQNNLSYDYVRALQALGSIEAQARNARKARMLFMESIRAARQGERLFPGMVSGASVYGLHAWARLEEKLGNWSKARDLLARAAGIQPGNAVIHHSRALLEAKAHNWGAARQHFLRAVEGAPSDLKCWHAWAIFEGSQGHHGKMRLLFQRALEVDPKSVHCLQAWAHQETLIGTKESKQTARSLFERCVQIEPKSLHSWQAWAVMESASGNYDKARELFEKCLKINSSSVISLQAFATMERTLENLCSAQRLLRKALKLEPENAAVLMEAAYVEKGLGNMEAAERLFVLAGMADKRESRVRNKTFHSRKEVMPHKAGDKLWRAFAKKNVKKSGTTGSNFETLFEAIKAKQQEVDSKRDVNTDEQSSSKPREGGVRRQVWTPNRSGA